MKYLAFLIIVLFTGCAANQPSLKSENTAQATPIQKAKTENISNRSPNSNSLPNDFEKSLPLKVREALENAEEIEILTFDEKKKDLPRIERFFINSHQISGNKLTRVAKDETRTQLLEAFYQDVKTGGAKAACFQPHHTIKVDYKGEKIAIAICFHCGQFVGIISNQQFGETLGSKKEAIKNKLKEERFSGSIPYIETSKSLPVFNKITGVSDEP